MNLIGLQKGKEMTEEEKAEDYEMDCIADVYRDDVCTIPYAYSAQKLEKAHLDGLVEGRKELEKENEELKQQIEKMKCCQNCKYGYKKIREEPCCNCKHIPSDRKIDKWELKE